MYIVQDPPSVTLCKIHRPVKSHDQEKNIPSENYINWVRYTTLSHDLLLINVNKLKKLITNIIEMSRALN